MPACMPRWATEIGLDSSSLDTNRSKFSLSPPPTTQRDGLSRASNSSKKGWARRTHSTGVSSSVEMALPEAISSKRPFMPTRPPSSELAISSPL